MFLKNKKKQPPEVLNISLKNLSIFAEKTPLFCQVAGFQLCNLIKVACMIKTNMT